MGKDLEKHSGAASGGGKSFFKCDRCNKEYDMMDIPRLQQTARIGSINAHLKSDLFVGFYTMSCLPLSSGSILCDYGSCSGEVNKDVAGADTAEADNSARFKRFNDQMQVEAPLRELLVEVNGMQVDDRILNPTPTNKDPRSARDRQINVGGDDLDFDDDDMHGGGAAQDVSLDTT
eukprot:gene15469-8680_t